MAASAIGRVAGSAEVAVELLADGPGVLAIGRDGERALRLAAVDAAHDEERPLEFGALLFQRHRLGHRQAAAEERAEGEELQLALGVDQAADRVAAQDQAAGPAVDLDVEPVGLAAGPARDPGDGRDPRGRFPDAGQIGFELVLQGHLAMSIMPVKPDGPCGPMTSCSSTPRPLRTLPAASV